MKTKDSAKKIFDMLAFQYRPMEKMLLRGLDQETAQKYQLLPYSRKIAILDMMASKFGL